jgi:ribosomal-protein-alanine N-acetyltransferase
MISFVKITKKNYRFYLDRIIEIEKFSFLSPWSQNAFIEEIGNSISYLWGLTADKILAGYICFWMYESEIQLINIAIHPQQRKKGFGHYLLKKMINEGISRDMRNVWLEVRPSNIVARNLYRRLGFEELGRRPGYYRDSNEDAIVMALTLSELEMAV